MKGNSPVVFADVMLISVSRYKLKEREMLLSFIHQRSQQPAPVTVFVLLLTGRKPEWSSQEGRHRRGRSSDMKDGTLYNKNNKKPTFTHTFVSRHSVQPPSHLQRNMDLHHILKNPPCRDLQMPKASKHLHRFSCSRPEKICWLKIQPTSVDGDKKNLLIISRLN